MSSHRKFRWLVPLLAFSITLAAFAVPASIMYQRLRLASNGGANDVRIQTPKIRLDLQKERLARFALLSTANLEEKTITAAHVPGMVGEVLISLPTTWPSTYVPATLPSWAWRCISLPVFCLPFWCFVGYGIDRLTARERTHWAVLTLGTLLSATMLFLGIGLTVLAYVQKESSIVIPVTGFYLWTILFAIFPYLWIAQRRWPSAVSSSATH